jgi:enoyl-CoA hydratase/carnithine racemase
MDVVARLEVEGVIARITLANSRRRNCVNLLLAQQLELLVEEAQNSGARVVILNGEGPVFSSGVDLNAPPEENQRAKAILDRLILKSTLPWIAKINNAVIGLGVSLVASCHVSIASEEAWWWLPELPRLGRMPWGVIADLGDLVSPAAIMGAMTTSNRFCASKAFAAGMVSMVTSAVELDQTVMNAATNLSTASDDALREIVVWWRQIKHAK